MLLIPLKQYLFDVASFSLSKSLILDPFRSNAPVILILFLQIVWLMEFSRPNSRIFAVSGMLRSVDERRFGTACRSTSNGQAVQDKSVTTNLPYITSQKSDDLIHNAAEAWNY
jgi:hypothetical protein